MRSNLFKNNVLYKLFAYKSHVCVYVCIYIYIYIYIYTHTHTPLDKNIRPPSKKKKKILFTIFQL